MVKDSNRPVTFSQIIVMASDLLFETPRGGFSFENCRRYTCNHDIFPVPKYQLMGFELRYFITNLKTKNWPNNGVGQSRGRRVRSDFPL